MVHPASDWPPSAEAEAAGDVNHLSLPGAQAVLGAFGPVLLHRCVLSSPVFKLTG